MWFLELFQWCYGTSIILSIISFLLMLVKATYLWTKKHPDTKIPKKIPKNPLVDYFYTALQLLLFVLCPLINLVFIYLAVFHLDEICDETVRKMEIKHGIT